MTRASDDLQKALSGLKAAARAELGAQADAALRAINDLSRYVGADDAGEPEGSPSSFASALELARVAIELDLQANAFYIASKKLDAVRAFLPAETGAPAPAIAEAAAVEEAPATPAAEVAPDIEPAPSEPAPEPEATTETSAPVEAKAAEPAPEPQAEAAIEQPAEASPAQPAPVAPDDVAVAAWEPLPEGGSFETLAEASKARVEDVAKSFGIETVHHHEAPAHLHENVAATDVATDAGDATPDASKPAEIDVDASPVEPRGVCFDDIAGEAKARVEEAAKSFGIETVHHHEAPAHLHENVAATDVATDAGEASPDVSQPAEPAVDASPVEPRGVSFDDIAGEAKSRVEEAAKSFGIETVHHHEAPAHLHENVAATDTETNAGDAAPDASEPGAPAHDAPTEAVTEPEAEPVSTLAADPSIEGVLQGGGGAFAGESPTHIDEVAASLESAPVEEAQPPEAPVEPAEPVIEVLEAPDAVEETQAQPTSEPAQDETPAAQPEAEQPPVSEATPAEVVSARDVVEATHDLGSPAEVAAAPVQDYGSPHEKPSEPQPVPVYEASQPVEEVPAQPQEAAPALESKPEPKKHEQKTLFSLWLDVIFGKKK